MSSNFGKTVLELFEDFITEIKYTTTPYSCAATVLVKEAEYSYNVTQLEISITHRTHSNKVYIEAKMPEFRTSSTDTAQTRTKRNIRLLQALEVFNHPRITELFEEKVATLRKAHTDKVANTTKLLSEIHTELNPALINELLVKLTTDVTEKRTLDISGTRKSVKTSITTKFVKVDDNGNPQTIYLDIEKSKTLKFKFDYKVAAKLDLPSLLDGLWIKNSLLG